MTNKELPEITQCKNILADLHEELDKIKKWAREAGYRRIPLWYDCQHLFDMISFYENRLKKLQRLHTKNTFAIYDHVMHKAGDVWAYDFIIHCFDTDFFERSTILGEVLENHSCERSL